MRRTTQAKNILIAVRPEASPLVSRTLGSEFPVVVCHTLQDAKRHLNEQVGLIVCGVHFDSGATFDLLSYAKDNPDTRSIPFFVLIGDAKQYSKAILEGIRTAAGIRGAQGFIELSSLYNDVGEENANAQLRQAIRHLLAQDDTGTSDNKPPLLQPHGMRWMTMPTPKTSRNTAEEPLPMPNMADKGHGRAMRADNALSLLCDHELCIVTMKDGGEREVRWDKAHGCFFAIQQADPTVYRIDAIEQWRPASIKF